MMESGAAAAPTGASGAGAHRAIWSLGPAPTRSASQMRKPRRLGARRRKAPARRSTRRARKLLLFATSRRQH
eukprot:12523886-Alexandrium_andersonii.AAC.1